MQMFNDNFDDDKVIPIAYSIQHKIVEIVTDFFIKHIKNFLFPLLFLYHELY